MMRHKIEQSKAYEQFGLPRGDYAVVTLHRPSNVDQKETLEPLVDILRGLSEKLPVFFPVHPRTKASLEKFELLARLQSASTIHCTAPVNYISFMNLVFNCRMVLTDSGGIQEETTYLGIPCITLRDNTERPITLSEGTNQLCNLNNVGNAIAAVLPNGHLGSKIPGLWDGGTSTRVANDIQTRFAG
jgi:UDP-N-acetylglucosamine 2-epimerase (non-hydrolysing)